MMAYIYRCSRKRDLYIYLATRDDFSNVPAAILQSLGNTEFSLQLDITTARRLAREDTTTVLKNLAVHGFHLQLPRNVAVEELMRTLAGSV
jgi:uncharacterized protein YcgL (UPF0745 family)